MDSEEFLLSILESDECKKIVYKRQAINKLMLFFVDVRTSTFQFDWWFKSFREYIKKELVESGIDLVSLVKYLIDADRNWVHWVVQDMLFNNMNATQLDALSLIVEVYIMDNLIPLTSQITDIRKEEVFTVRENAYHLTKVNGATFYRDGLLFDGKVYYYNPFTNKMIIDPLDTMPGFARIIKEECGKCDFLYRLDERLMVPSELYEDYSGVELAKFYGPQLNFNGDSINGVKTITVHIDTETEDKLLMVKKVVKDDTTNELFWHVMIETVGKPENNSCCMTTFLHGMYYPEKEYFTHIDYTKNEYNSDVYKQKYQESKTGLSIDKYTENDDQHYKIWCVENGNFSVKTWYKLMIVSLEERYRRLLDEILGEEYQM